MQRASTYNGVCVCVRPTPALILFILKTFHCFPTDQKFNAQRELNYDADPHPPTPRMKIVVWESIDDMVDQWFVI